MWRSRYINPVCSDLDVPALASAYYANQFFFKSRLVSKKSKLTLYWSIIRPIITYCCETWVLKGTVKNKLMIFERKVLRKIFGPTKERDGTWRIKKKR